MRKQELMPLNDVLGNPHNEWLEGLEAKAPWVVVAVTQDLPEMPVVVVQWAVAALMRRQPLRNVARTNVS
jgi:hypothetical protein